MYFSIKHKLLYYELKLAIHTFNFLFCVIQRYNLSTFIIGKKERKEFSFFGYSFIDINSKPRKNLLIIKAI